VYFNNKTLCNKLDIQNNTYHIIFRITKCCFQDAEVFKNKSTCIEAIVSFTIGCGFEKLACVYKEGRVRRMDRGMKSLENGDIRHIEDRIMYMV